MTTLDEAWAAGEAAIAFAADDPRYKHGEWRLSLTGPWPMIDPNKRYWAKAEPYNATGIGLDREVDAVGPTPAAAIESLMQRLSNGQT